MTWRDRLQPASFRGVPFFVETEEADLGRRVEILRFPGREDTVAQDLGKDASEFNVQAYVIGADYDAQLRELERALLTRGSGRLVLPMRGELTVYVNGRFKTSFSRTKMGMATVSFQCTTAAPQAPLFATPNNSEALRAICDSLIDGAATRAAATIDTAGLSAGTVASQVTLVTSMSEAMRTATQTIASIVADVAATEKRIAAMASQAETLLATPADLADSLGQSFEALFMDAADLIPDGTSVLSRDVDPTLFGLRRKVIATVKRALTQSLDMTFLPDLDTSTTNLERETTNLRATSAVYRMQAVGAFARAIPDFPWSSYQEAIAARDFFADVIDGIEGEVDDDDYEALRDLGVSVSRYLASVALKLPVLRTHYPRDETCALLIAHELYGDARREAEIVARNNVPNPANIPPTLALEVSSV